MALKPLAVEILNFTNDDYPFILHKNVNASFDEFFTNWHAEPEIIYTLSGTESIFIDSDAVVNHAGDFAVISSGHIHTGTGDNWTHHCLIPSFDFLKNLGIDHTQYTLPTQINDPEIQKLFLDFIKETETDDAFTRSFAIVAAQKFVLSLYRKYGSPLQAGQSSKVDAEFDITIQVLNYLRNHFSEDFSIDVISKEINVTTSYMCRCVKSTTGVSIIDHLNTFRCRAACHYLLHSDKKISEIATLCGYNGSSYFSKIFRHIMGKSPSDIPRKNK